MNRIKEVLKEQGRIQTWSALNMNITKSTVAQYCNNKSQLKILTLYKMAQLLNVDAKDLLA